MNKVLVTGGAGFIGSHVCRELLNSGYTPIVVDDLSTGYRHNVKWGELIILDLKNRAELLRKFERYEILGVIHLAASAYVEESQKFPLKYFDNNLVSTINILLLMKQLGIKNIVFSSSCSTYGVGDGRVFTEDSEQIPINNYGLSKKMCEDVVTESVKANHQSSTILRYFNASGTDMLSGIIEEHQPETHVIPLMVDSALGGRVFEVFGDDYETNDGSAIRDYVHVKDLATAHVSALELMMDKPGNYVFNLGSGKGVSVFELIESLTIMGFEPNYVIGSRRTGDPASLVAEISRAQQILKWQPLESNIEQILKSVIESRKKMT